MQEGTVQSALLSRSTASSDGPGQWASGTYLQAAVHGGLGRVHDEVAQGEAKAILETFVQQQCPRPLPGEGAPRRAPISRAQGQLWEHRETGEWPCDPQPQGPDGDLTGSMGLQAPSSSSDLPSSLTLISPTASSFFLSSQSPCNAFAAKEMTRCSEPGVGSVQFTKCSLSTYCVPGAGHAVPAAV